MTTETIEPTAEAYVIQPDEGRLLDQIGVRLLATGAGTGGALLAGVCVNPGPGGPPMHSHHTWDEAYLVLQGRYRFKVGDEVYEGGPGTFAFMPRDTSHTFASVGTEEGKLLAITLPACDGFLEGMNELAARGVEQREMLEHFTAFDSTIDGPPAA